MRHLTLRVHWHDSKWNGCVCVEPSENPYRVALDRIRDERDDSAEEAAADRPWWELPSDGPPACFAESGAFMNPEEWPRVFRHPYAGLDETQTAHGHLKPTRVKVPPYSTFAVPFAWMLRSEQSAIGERTPQQLPLGGEAPLNTPWVFTRER